MVKHEPEWPNTVLQLTSPDAAQSVLRPLCLLSGLAAEYHVGHAREQEALRSAREHRICLFSQNPRGSRVQLEAVAEQALPRGRELMPRLATFWALGRGALVSSRQASSFDVASIPGLGARRAFSSSRASASPLHELGGSRVGRPIATSRQGSGVSLGRSVLALSVSTALSPASLALLEALLPSSLGSRVGAPSSPMTAHPLLHPLPPLSPALASSSGSGPKSVPLQSGFAGLLSASSALFCAVRRGKRRLPADPDQHSPRFERHLGSVPNTLMVLTIPSAAQGVLRPPCLLLGLAAHQHVGRSASRSDRSLLNRGR